jgi:hypothetical protein
MSPYEQEVLQKLRDWQAQPPTWGTRLLAKPSTRVSQAVQALVPPSVLQAALEGVNRLAHKLSDERAILKRANADVLEDLHLADLEDCDRLAGSERKRAMAAAGIGGTAFGAAGAMGLVADIPVLLTLALRAIHRTGLCYGERVAGAPEQRLPIGVFALASANSMEEKQTALTALRDEVALDTAAWRDGLERVAEREIAKNAAVFSLQNLARNIGVNLGQRKAAGTIPVVGAVIGASVNAWYLYDVSCVAQYVFQERWLRRRHAAAFVKTLPATP